MLRLLPILIALVLLIAPVHARAQTVEATAQDFVGTWRYSTAQQAGLGSLVTQGTLHYRADGTLTDAGTMTLSAQDALTRRNSSQSLSFTVEKTWLVAAGLLVETVTKAQGGSISGGMQVIPFQQMVPVGSQTALTIVQVQPDLIILSYQGAVITLQRQP